MFKKLIMACLALTMAHTQASAQRATDALDRGLVAVQTSGGVYCSWRILGEEYYDVTYNLYRDGVKVNSEPCRTTPTPPAPPAASTACAPWCGARSRLPAMP